MDVAEQGQVVALRKARQLLVGREGQVVQVQDARPPGVGHDAVALAPDQVGDVGQGPALGQVQQGAFALAQAQGVQLGEMLQQRGAQTGGVGIARHHPQLRSGRLEQDRQIHGIHEARGGGREAHQFRLRGQDLRGLGLQRRGGQRAEAVVDRRGVAVLLEPGRQRQDPHGREAVGQHGEIGLARDEVEARGVDEGDAHGPP